MRAPIETLKSAGGRPKNSGLHLAVQYISSFWIYDLGREYTFDEINGEGVAEAFHFTKKLIKKIDNIADKQIKTAMRAKIRDRRAFEKSIGGNNSLEKILEDIANGSD